MANADTGNSNTTDTKKVTVYALRAFRYKKDGKVYLKDKPVEIPDADVESYIKRKLVTKEKPAAAKDTKDDKGDKDKK